MSRSVRARVWLGALLLLGACGGGMRAQVAEAARTGDVEAARARYAEIRASDGDDEDLLGYVAEAVLVAEARSGEDARRQAAVQQLGLAGTRGREPLERLAAGTGP
ncbi:MAG: hypothetical protein K1X94_30960, partial [Sandaracinaceae bacterium]|nr:hypothetical protein [Sandaracinaceae bacterium]